MALSMDEQRILAEIEQELSRAEPALAVRLSTFRSPGVMAVLRSPRVRLLVTLAAAVTLAVVSMVAYALVSLRGAPQRGVTGPTAAPGQSSVTVPRAHSGTHPPTPASGTGSLSTAP
jgi:cytochrome c-type biogenesis protein CcmH/NrfG